MVDVGIDATLNDGSGTSYAGKYQVYINLENPCDVARNLTECKARIELNSDASGIQVQFRSYAISGTSMVLVSQSSWMSTTTIGDYVRTFTTSFVCDDGDYLACVIYDPNADYTGADATVKPANSSYSYEPAVLVGGDSDNFSVITNYLSHTSGNANGVLSGATGVETGSGTGIGGNPTNVCQTLSGNWYANDAVDDTWGYIEPTDFDLTGTKKAYCTLVYPWDTTGDEQYDQVLTEGVAHEVDNPNDSSEHWRVTITSITDWGSGIGAISELIECWWREEPNGNVYVDANNGSDSNFGVSWDTAYATITKGMTEVSTGAIVNVMGGTYSSETSPEPNRRCYMKPRALDDYPTYTEIAADDTFSNSDNPDLVLGANTSMQIAYASTYQSIGYMKFDISSIPTTDIITSVKLSIYGAGGGSNDDYNMYNLTQDFDESTLTWNNSPTAESTPFFEFNTSDSWYNIIGRFEMELPTTWVSNSLTNGWCGFKVSGEPYGSISWYTKETSVTTAYPYLIVEHYPNTATQIIIT